MAVKRRDAERAQGQRIRLNHLELARNAGALTQIDTWLAQ
jgi:hypothetical protein